MTLFNLKEDFSLQKEAFNQPWQLLGTEMTKATWGGNPVLEDPWGRKSRGDPNFHLQAEGDATPLDTLFPLEVKMMNLDGLQVNVLTQAYR